MPDLQPTEGEKMQSLLAYQDLVETLNRFTKEGMHPAAIQAGLSSACTHFIMVHQGPERVAEWFALQSAMTMGIRNKPSN